MVLHVCTLNGRVCVENRTNIRSKILHFELLKCLNEDGNVDFDGTLTIKEDTIIADAAGS